MNKEYLDLEGLRNVAGKVNSRLKTVTEMPTSASEGAIRLYVGKTNSYYTTGHIYQYQQTSLEPVAYGWVDISMSDVQPLFQVDLDGADPSNYSAGKIYQALDDGTTSDGISVTKGHFYIVQENESSGDWEWVDISNSGSVSASDVSYNNSSSGLSSGNVQGAIDEVNTKVDNIPQAVVPKGTIAFASLPSLASVEVGWMYNISDDFTTTSDFVISGISEKAGSNVYCIDTGSGVKKWDVFAAGGGGSVVVDQNYDPTSTNPQSGTAVAQAIGSVVVPYTAVAYDDFDPSSLTPGVLYLVY